MALKDMPLRVLVTGAGGFVGRHLITALDKVLAPGSEIVAGFLHGEWKRAGESGAAPNPHSPCAWSRWTSPIRRR